MDLYVNLWHNLQLVERSHYLVEVDIYMLCRCLYGFVWICVRVVSVCKLFRFVLFLSVSLKKWQQTFFCCFYKINVRENRRGNQEFTIQRYRQHCAQKTQKENDQLKTKRWASGTHCKTGVESRCPRRVSGVLLHHYTYERLM
jgi:predicted membrane metal-binding protein